MTHLTVISATMMLGLATSAWAGTPVVFDKLAADAVALETTAGYMVTNQMSTMSADWQAMNLYEVKTSVNRMATTLQRYATSADASEQDAANLALPLLKQVSADTTAALESISRSLPLPVNARLREALVKLDADSRELNRTISEQSRLTKLRAETARLESDIRARSTIR
jgi:hypothetical protein